MNYLGFHWAAVSVFGQRGVGGGGFGETLIPSQTEIWCRDSALVTRWQPTVRCKQGLDLSSKLLSFHSLFKKDIILRKNSKSYSSRKTWFSSTIILYVITWYHRNCILSSKFSFNDIWQSFKAIAGPAPRLLMENDWARLCLDYKLLRRFLVIWEDSAAGAVTPVIRDGASTFAMPHKRKVTGELGFTLLCHSENIIHALNSFKCEALAV